MNELNIKSAEQFILYKLDIKPELIRHSKDFKLKDKLIFVTNANSDLFLHPMIRSLYKNVNKDDFTLCIFDNSWTSRFPEELYFQYGFDNIISLDNTKRGVVEGIEESEFRGSIIHCKTVDFCLKYFKQEGVKDFILVDSDVLFKTNPFNVVDKDYVCVGEYEDEKSRIKPYFQYFNLEKLDINYYDETRMLGITSYDCYVYDTGMAFTEDLKKYNKPVKYINIEDYIAHFYGGSYVYAQKEIAKYHKIDCTEQTQPQKSYELVYQWLKDNNSLYL